MGEMTRRMLGRIWQVYRGDDWRDTGAESLRYIEGMTPGIPGLNLSGI